MDGQQRLNAIIEFYENELKLTGLKTWKDLNGYTYGKCPPRIQRGLGRRRIRRLYFWRRTLGRTERGHDPPRGVRATEYWRRYTERPRTTQFFILENSTTF